MSQDNHLRVGSHDIAFKSHVESIGLYIDATLSMAKRTDHISRSVYLELRRMSFIRHLLTRKATAQLMCSFVLSRLDYGNSLPIDVTADRIISVSLMVPCPWNTDSLLIGVGYSDLGFMSRSVIMKK